MDEVEFYLIDLKSRFDKIKPNTYYLSYSGGKDSHFLYWFIKEYLKSDLGRKRQVLATHGSHWKPATKNKNIQKENLLKGVMCKKY